MTKALSSLSSLILPFASRYAGKRTDMWMVLESRIEDGLREVLFEDLMARYSRIITYNPLIVRDSNSFSHSAEYPPYQISTLSRHT